MLINLRLLKLFHMLQMLLELRLIFNQLKLFLEKVILFQILINTSIDLETHVGDRRRIDCISWSVTRVFAGRQRCAQTTMALSRMNARGGTRHDLHIKKSHVTLHCEGAVPIVPCTLAANSSASSVASCATTSSGSIFKLSPLLSH